MDWNDRVSNLEHKCSLPSRLLDTLSDRISILEKELGATISALPTNIEDRINNLETMLEEKLKKQ